MRVPLKLKRLYSQLQKIFGRNTMLIVTGTYWGDEGKGKVIDLLSKLYKMTIRFSGGAGAGHTLVTPDGKKFIGHLIPCGIAQLTTCVLGRGEFFDLKRFLVELRQAKKVFGDTLPPIWIDRFSPLWTEYHQLLEIWLEFSKKKGKIHTTGKAIGPLAGLKSLRSGLKVRHLFGDHKILRNQLEALYRELKPLFDEMVRLGIVRRKDILLPLHVQQKLLKDAPKIAGYVKDTARGLYDACRAKVRMLFEAAQAPGLDINMGTWPFVSSGHSVAAGAPLGTGLSLKEFKDVVILMVMKALPTRVGAGPFPSEIWDRLMSERFSQQNPKLFKKGRARENFLGSKLALINSDLAKPKDWAQYFQVLGYELGATTGRGRSIGWMDIMWLHYTIRINGPTYFALTRFDMLSGLDKVPVVVGYELDGKRLEIGDMPDTDNLFRVKPIVEMWPCWKDDIYGCANWKDLPYAAKQFVWKLEKIIGVPIVLIGTGPKRDAMIVRTAAKKN